MKYEEKETRGSFDFPISYYFLDKNHLRYTMRCHWHREPELIHILNGTLTVKVGGETFEGQPGDIFYVNSAYLHSAVPHDCIYECTVCELSLMDDACRDLVSNFIFPTKLEGKTKKFAHYILSALAARPAGWKFSVKGGFQSLYGEFLNQETMIPRSILPSQHAVKEVIKYIEENFREQITLEILSDVSGLSPKYFERIFKEMTGKSPIRYVNAYRLYKASNRLRMTGDPVTEIAYDCGFSDLSYFIKLFRAMHGVSPSVFRKKQ